MTVGPQHGLAERGVAALSAHATAMKRPLAKTPRWTQDTPKDTSAEPAAETCPLSATLRVIQEMLCLKYSQQLDESDFLSKAEVRIGSDDCFDPAAIAAALNSEPAFRIHDAAHERLIQLQLKVRAVSSFAELKGCMERWPGTCCAVVELEDAQTLSGNNQVVAAFRQAYDDPSMLVGKTHLRATGRAGPLRVFGQEGFKSAVVLDPVIVRMLRYEPAESQMLDLQLPSLNSEYHRESSPSTAAMSSSAPTEAAVALRMCRAMEGLAPAFASDDDEALQASIISCILLNHQLMGQHPSDAAVQVAGCCALRRLVPPGARNLPASEARSCIELIAAAMRRHALSTSVQESACVALASIVGALPEMQSFVNTNGGIEQIVVAMGQFPESASLQMWAIGALAALCANHPMNQSAIAACRGLEAVTFAMQEHVADVELQVMACGALGNLVARHTNNQSAVASCRGLECILGTMAVHQGVVSVQESAIAALWCLVSDHLENQAAACSLRAVELISNAIHRFGGLPEGSALKPLASGALQVLLPGFSSALASASSQYTARALGAPPSPTRSSGALQSRRESPDRASLSARTAPLSVRSVSGSESASTFRWLRASATARDDKTGG